MRSLFLTVILCLMVSLPVAAQDEVWSAPQRIYYVGTISSLPIQMDLELEMEQYSGSYFYLRSGGRLMLEGELREFTDISLIEKNEDGEVTGTFTGTLDEETGEISGTWSPPDGSRKLPFTLEPKAWYGDVIVRRAPGIGAMGIYPVAKGYEEIADILRAEFLVQTAAFCDEALDAWRDSRENGWPWRAYTQSDEYAIHYLDDAVLCLQENWNEYTGGAHPNNAQSGHTWQRTLLEITPLTLEDLFKGNTHWFETLQGLILADLRRQEAMWVVDGTVTGFEREELTWLIAPHGITFLFSPYAVGPYAQGPMQVTIPWKELEAVLDPEGLAWKWIN